MTSEATASEPSAALEALEALVAEVRRLMLAAATTDVDDVALAQARQLIERAAGVLEAQSREHGVRVHFDREAIARTRAGEPWRVFRHNPLGIPLEIRVRDDHAEALLQPSPLLEGPPRLLHGGFSAAMMDALLSTLVQAQDVRAVTGRLQVQLLAPVPLDQPLVLQAHLTSREGRKIGAVGEISRAGEVVVRAEGLFIALAGEPD